MKKVLRFCSTVIAFIALMTGVLAFPSPALAATTTVRVTAPAQVNAGQTFSVNISVTPGQAIAGVQCDLDFDGSLITATGVSEGGLLQSTGGATFFNPGSIGGGSVSGMAGVIITPGKTVTAAGTFATITFMAGTTSGTSTLTLSGVVVGDISGSQVPISVTNTQVIVVGQTNHAPVLNGIGDKETNVGQALTFTISATDQDGDSLTYSASGLPSGASFNPSTRRFSWTPGALQAGVYPGVTFQVSDGNLTDSESITITVLGAPANRAPSLNPLGDMQTGVGQALIFTVSASDPDGDSLTYSASNLPSGASFNAGSRTFSWTPSIGQIGTFPGVAFQVSDGQLTDSETITITVSAAPTNRAPALNSIGDMEVVAGKTLTFIISATDQDGDALIYSASNLPSGANFNPATRTFSWTPSAAQVGAYPGVVFGVSDGALSDSETVTITVLPDTQTNRAPVLSPIGNKQVSAGQGLSFTVSATDPDGDAISLSVSNLPGGATFNPATGAFAWTPDATQVGSYPGIIFQASDGKLTASETIVIVVTAPAVPNPPEPPKILTISGVNPTGINKTGVNIEWMTNLPATGQVQYWIDGSSDKQLSALSAVLVTQHSVLLFGLLPASVYHFMVTSTIDASTAATSSESTFKTLGSAATFSVADLTVSPGEVTIGQASSVTVVVNNTGDLPGDYALALILDGNTYASKVVAVPAGGSQTVTFPVAIDQAGTHNLSAGAKSVSLEVIEPKALQLSTFTFTPYYLETQQLSFVRIDYKLSDAVLPGDKVTIRVKVLLNGKLVDEIPVFISTNPSTYQDGGTLDYTPSAGWQPGVYSFSANLTSGSQTLVPLATKNIQQTIGVSTPIISWTLLAVIIGGALFIGAVIIAIILMRYHRLNRLLRAYNRGT